MSVAMTLKATQFAAEKHRDQHRKDAGGSPYINHPLALASILAVEGGVENPRGYLCSAVARHH